MSWIDRLLGTAHDAPVRASDVMVGLQEFAQVLVDEREACLEAKERIEGAGETLRTLNKDFKRVQDVIKRYAPGSADPFEQLSLAQYRALQADLEVLRNAISAGVDALGKVRDL